MDLKKLLPQGKFSEEAFKALTPIFEAENFFRDQEYEQAETKYLEALKAFPERSGGRFLVYNKLGIVYERLKLYDRAIETYEKCVTEGSVTPFTYQRLASLNMDSGKYRKAMDYCEKGIKQLKLAKTTVPQEFYFWIIFKNMKRKSRRMAKKS